MITKISNIKFAQPIQLESKKQQVEQAPHYGPYPADIATCGFASSAFARHYSRNLG